MTWRGILGTLILLAAVSAVAIGLTYYKRAEARRAADELAARPEPAEFASVVHAGQRPYQRTTGVIGTVLALRSITLRPQLAGAVAETRLVPGKIVEAGDLLVRLDVSVEEAELAALEAQAELAEIVLRRMTRARETKAASEIELDRARAEKEIAVANVARTRAVIERKTMVAPFRARVGMVDLHLGQYLDAGTPITTLQGVDDEVHVDFTVAQSVAEGLRPGDQVAITSMRDERPIAARVVALDARIDPATRNAVVRAIMPGGEAFAPGASVRVRVPVGPETTVVTVPVTALRRGPAGDHVLVVAAGQDGRPRASVRPVTTGPMIGDDVVVFSGLTAGEPVAASGSFKLRDGVLVINVPGVAAESRSNGGG